MISNPITGAGYFLKGLGLINKPGVRRYVLIPLAINIALFAAGLWFAIDQFSLFIDWAFAGLPEWTQWLQWILWPVFAVSFLSIVFLTFSIIANIIGAPFNSYLSAAVEKSITGTKPIGAGNNLVVEIKDAMMGELKKLLYFFLWAIPLLLLSLLSLFLPIIAPITSVLWIVFGAWMMSIEYTDYPMGNQGLTFPDIRRKLTEKRVLTLGFGGAVMFGTLLPIFNFIVMPIAVAGATAMRVKEF